MRVDVVTRFPAMFHGVLAGILALTFIGSLVNLFQSAGDHQRLYSASLIAVLTLCMMILFIFARSFPLCQNTAGLAPRAAACAASRSTAACPFCESGRRASTSGPTASP